MSQRLHLGQWLEQRASAGLMLMALTALGCSSSESSSEPEERGPASMPGPSGATCPDADDSPRYGELAVDFFARYCVRCHSSELSGSARHGAPRSTNLDTLEGVQAASLEMLDQLAAAGPLQENTFMPPAGPAPSPAERERLGQWLACGLP
jgi:hypothetical protein